MGASKPARRTQKERREATIARLLTAAIEVLAERGCAGASTKAICARAGVSQGALFRHFPNRSAVLAATAEAVLVRNLERMQARFADPAQPVPAAELVAFCRAVCRDETGVAWREVLLAARTDPALREAVAPPVKVFEQAIVAWADTLAPSGSDSEELAMVLLTMLHAFDSEAVTVVPVPSPEIEARRSAWFTHLLEQTLHPPATPNARE